MTKSVVRIALEGASLGTVRHLLVHRYRPNKPVPEARKVYIQASLHADELPGMMAVHHLLQQLDAADRNSLPNSAYAFPEQRKEPLTDASHVRNAIARFDQVKDVSDAERELAFANITKAAKAFDVEMAETRWQQLGKRPHTKNAAH